MYEVVLSDGRPARVDLEGIDDAPCAAYVEVYDPRSEDTYWVRLPDGDLRTEAFALAETERFVESLGEQPEWLDGGPTSEELLPAADYHAWLDEQMSRHEAEFRARWGTR